MKILFSVFSTLGYPTVPTQSEALLCVEKTYLCILQSKQRVFIAEKTQKEVVACEDQKFFCVNTAYKVLHINNPSLSFILSLLIMNTLVLMIHNLFLTENRFGSFFKKSNPENFFWIYQTYPRAPGGLHCAFELRQCNCKRDLSVHLSVHFAFSKMCYRRQGW